MKKGRKGTGKRKEEEKTRAGETLMTGNKRGREKGEGKEKKQTKKQRRRKEDKGMGEKIRYPM